MQKVLALYIGITYNKSAGGRNPERNTMTQIIDYKTNEQEDLRKLQSECRIWMEVIEELENMEQTDEVAEALKEANENLSSIEAEITRRVWKR